MNHTVSTVSDRSIRWGVVATVREAPVLVLAFVCHHLALGAERVHLFFDAPNDPSIPVAREIAGVEVTVCDAAYWAAQGFDRAPGIQTKRQTVNANHVMATSDLDWILHADADEFLWLPGPLEAEVSSLPQDARWLHVPNLERCWLGPVGDEIFGGIFRAPLHDTPVLETAVYGKRAAALSGGMGGYSAGKAFARPGHGFLAIHKVRAEEAGDELPSGEAPSARILHFDGITPRHWAVKNLRYATQGAAMNQLLNRERMASIGAILRAQDPERAGVRVYEALYCLAPAEAQMLAEAGRLLQVELDIPGALARFAPHRQPDLSMRAFDALHQAELSARSQAIVRKKRRARRQDG